MRNRFVKATRQQKMDGSPGSTYYAPVELRNGNLYVLASECEFDHGLGYEDVQDAWNVIDAIETREKETDARAANG